MAVTPQDTQPDLSQGIVQVTDPEPLDDRIVHIMAIWGTTTRTAIEQFNKEGYPGWASVLMQFYLLVGDVLDPKL